MPASESFIGAARLWQCGGMRDRRGLEEVHGSEWVHGLVDADTGIRAAALARHHALLEARHAEEVSRTLVGLVDAFTAFEHGSDSRRRGNHRRLAPYGVVFLQWERRFPAEWRDGWTYSPWSAKEAVLAAFCAGGPTPETGPALADLLLATVHRRQRCQDRWYWRLARRLDSPPLRTRLEAAAEGADDLARLRAGFVLWSLEHPQEGVGSAAWRRWLRSEGRPATSAIAGPGLAAMKPAAAASVLAGLAPADAAIVLEGLHAGPAARILAVMSPLESAARAVELMDVRLAARALKAMDPPAAAGVLAGMAPSAAAVRFPGSSRAQLLLLMDIDAAVARLCAMAPAAAGERLEFLPPARAAALLMRMDSSSAARALTRMGWWGPSRVLSEMPPAVAADLLAKVAAEGRFDGAPKAGPDSELRATARPLPACG
ncbi:hypothetical protein [Planotetraspora mira]|nr:hypothetical protein [Planotetraspora mira]